MGKKKGNNKQAWLDWLADDPPAPDAQQELRDRFKQQANSYQPVNRSQQPPTTPVQPPVTPQPSAAMHQTVHGVAAHQTVHGVAAHETVHGVAAPQPAPQAQAVSNTIPAAKPAPTASPAATSAPNPTVSIQIHIPSLQSERFRRLVARVKQGIAAAKTWFRGQLALHKARTLMLAIGVPLLVVLLLLPPLLHFGSGKPKASGGGSAGSSAGATVKYDKPTFEVVTPSTKTKLATPDGTHAAYDGAKNIYSYLDNIGGNGFTVSQQPIPPQYSDGATAVESIAPTLDKDSAPTKLNIITGTAYVSTNQKYHSQTLVLNVRDVLLFIQSSHSFKNSEWESYINTLQ
jgi:hypothetical protein